MKFKNVLLILLSGAVVVLGGLYLHTFNQLVDVKGQAAQLARQVDELSLLADAVTDQANANSALYSDVIGLTDQETSDVLEPMGPELPSELSQNQDLVSVQKPEEQAPPQEQAPASDQTQEGTLSAPKDEHSAFAVEESAPLKNFIDQEIAKMNNTNGQWAIYAASLDSQIAVSGQSQRMQAASLIKLYIMGAVYEQYDNLAAVYGADAVNANLRSMITVSDNTASNTLVNWLGNGDDQAGMNLVNEYCAGHGFSNTHMGRLLLAPNTYDDNYTSVEDCGNFLLRVYNQDPDFPHSQEMLDLLCAQERTSKIPFGLPEGQGIQCGNKTGELADVENDAAVIFSTPKKDYVLCVMSQNLSDAASARQEIVAISSAVYSFFNLNEA